MSTKMARRARVPIDWRVEQRAQDVIGFAHSGSDVWAKHWRVELAEVDPVSSETAE